MALGAERAQRLDDAIQAREAIRHQRERHRHRLQGQIWAAAVFLAFLAMLGGMAYELIAGRLGT